MVAEISAGAQRSVRFAFKRNVAKALVGLMKKHNAGPGSAARWPN
jgi:hypothetical protein